MLILKKLCLLQVQPGSNMVAEWYKDRQVVLISKQNIQQIYYLDTTRQNNKEQKLQVIQKG